MGMVIVAGGDDLAGLREALHYPLHLSSIQRWPWAARGSAELLMLFLGSNGLPEQMADYVRAVLTLGDKREVLSIQKTLDSQGQLTGFQFNLKDGESHKVYIIHVGAVKFGDRRDSKYVINHKYMAMAHGGALYAMCMRTK